VEKMTEYLFTVLSQKTTAVGIGLELLSPQSPASILHCSAPKNGKLKVEEHDRLAILIGFF
jgi:hypothetical protein